MTDSENERLAAVERKIDALSDAVRQQSADVALCVNYIRVLAQAMGAAERLRQAEREVRGGNGEDG